MHEQTIAKRIIEEVQTYGDVESVTIEVGDLAHLPANEMKAVLEKMTEWKINVVSKKSKILCECGHTGEPVILQQMHDQNIYECPECKQMMPKIIEGGDITLKEVTLTN